MQALLLRQPGRPPCRPSTPSPPPSPPRHPLPPSQRLQVRKQIGEAVAGGNIDRALSLVRQVAPGLLAADPHIHFRLQCQKMAEMVRGG